MIEPASRSPIAIACGELLIDFVSTQAGVSLGDAPGFVKAAGGAPANVAVGLARLGLPSGFTGKVGDDDFGHGLAEELARNGVDVSHLLFSREARTALAFVSLRADGERDFMFYRHPSADMLYSPEDVDPDYIGAARIFHFGSVTLGAEPSRAATLHSAEVAKAAGLTISYDPNVRLNLWPSVEAAREGAMLGWPYANIAKVSEEELTFLSGVSDLADGARRLWHERLRLLVVTHGSEGCAYFTESTSGRVPGFSVQVVDTTGAGDAFVAGMHFSLFPSLDERLSRDEIERALRFANATGALATTKRGAIPSLPTREEVEKLLADR